MSTAAGQAQYSMLLKLSAGADQYYTALEATTKATEDATKAAQAALEKYAASNLSNALSVLQKSVAAEKTALTATYNASIKSTQSVIDGLSTSVSKLSSLSASLKSALNSMVAPNSEAINRKNAQAFITSALAMAKAGNAGAIDEAKLNDALSIVAKPSEALFSTFEDYQRDFLKTSINISELSDATASQASKAVSQLDVAKSQLEAIKTGYEKEVARLDAIISNAQLQIDAINGTTTAVLSIAAALSALAAAATLSQSVAPAAGAATSSSIAGDYQSILGRAPDAAGLSYWTGQAARGMTNDTIKSFMTNSTEAKTNALYQSILGRAPDAAGAAYWSNAIDGGMSTDQVASLMKQSPEYINGSHANGLDYVPFDGYRAELHKGERVLTASQARNSGDNSELIAEVKMLREEIRAGQAAMVSATKATTKILRDVTQDGQSISTTVAA
jgi:hypothetical protein